MPAIAREGTYRSAIDMAVSELSQISEQMESLVVRKVRLEKATEGLKHLLGMVVPGMNADQNNSHPAREMDSGGLVPNGAMPSGDFSSVMRFPDRQQ